MNLKFLAEAAQIAGTEDPKDYAIFQNKGYQGLYGGLPCIKTEKMEEIKSNQIIMYDQSLQMVLLVKEDQI